MKSIVRAVVTMVFLVATLAAQVAMGSRGKKELPNRMSYHNVQGIEMQLGYYHGENVDTYYLLMNYSASQFSAPQRLVLGVNKERAIAELGRLVDSMNMDHDFEFVDKSGVRYRFESRLLAGTYTISWESRNDGRKSLDTKTYNVESALVWLDQSTVWGTDIERIQMMAGHEELNFAVAKAENNKRRLK